MKEYGLGDQITTENTLFASLCSIAPCVGGGIASIRHSWPWPEQMNLE